MSGHTYYNAQSADQETYLQMMALLDAKETARMELRTAWIYAEAMVLKDPAGVRQRIDQASADFVVATRQARNIHWHEAIGGWYYRD